MTRTGKFIGLLIVVALAATGCNYLHRNTKGISDHVRMHRFNRAMEFGHMGRMGHGRMSLDGKFMFQGPGYGRHGNRWQEEMPGMRRGRGMGMGYGPKSGMRRGSGPLGPGHMQSDNMRFQRIPGLTDTQREEIASLKENQMQEMDKLREETFSKMQNIREENRKKMMSLLTDEQKKFMESGPGSVRSEKAQVAK